LQKNRLIFLQGLLFSAQNAVLGLFFGILAQKSAISSARIAMPSIRHADFSFSLNYFLFLNKVFLFLKVCL
jgi:hypothetical protein